MVASNTAANCTLGNLVTGIIVSHWGVRTALLVNGVLAFLCQAALTGLARRRGPAGAPAR